MPSPSLLERDGTDWLADVARRVASGNCNPDVRLLFAEVLRLRGLNESLAVRVAAAHDVIGMCAERNGLVHEVSRLQQKNEELQVLVRKYLEQEGE